MLARVAVPDIKEYRTIENAVKDERVPYTAYWVRRLCREGKIAAQKFGSGRKSVWLVHLPDLVRYAERMKELGDQKHAS